MLVGRTNCSCRNRGLLLACKLCGRACLSLVHLPISPSSTPPACSWKYFTSCCGGQVAVLWKECSLFRSGIFVSNAHVQCVVLSGNFSLLESNGILEANWLIFHYIFLFVWFLVVCFFFFATCHYFWIIIGEMEEIMNLLVDFMVMLPKVEL